jgi:hypothetical protein
MMLGFCITRRIFVGFIRISPLVKCCGAGNCGNSLEVYDEIVPPRCL